MSEIAAMVVSNILLLYFHDIVAFRCVFGTGIVSYFMLVFGDYLSLALTYLAIVLLIVSIGGWLNINLLIMELRVPPENVAAVQLMTRTMAVGSAILTPTIASFHPPFPYLILLTVSLCGFLASTRLPVPGHHLPMVEETDESKVKLVERGSENVTMLQNIDNVHIVEPTPLMHHSMSNVFTYTEN